MTRWVVTDLDGTLLDHSYSWEPARSTVAALKQQGVLVIPCTSKTAEEVRAFRQDAELSDPFIVENGGAIYGNNADGSEWVVPLGAAHSVLRPNWMNSAKPWAMSWWPWKISAQSRARR